jgi:hypothetical protein
LMPTLPPSRQYQLPGVSGRLKNLQTYKERR